MLPRLSSALNQALDAGLTISELQEVLVQLYAYAGFPRSLNALGALLTVLEQRRARGLHDDAGPAPGPLPAPQQMLAVGDANRRGLVGGPSSSPLFDFAPVIDQFLKSHLFGDIFARDNLDWRSRELATVGALAALDGTDAQLRSHLGMSLNIGLSEGQLRDGIEVLRTRVAGPAGERTDAALTRQLPHRARAAAGS